MERATKELKAFTKIALQPGETKSVSFDIHARQLAYYDESLGNFVVELIEYEVFAGAHSLDRNALKARFVIRDDES